MVESQERKNKKIEPNEQRKISEIRDAAIEEAKRLKKEGKGITTNVVEVVCTEKDIFQSKAKKKNARDYCPSD